MEEEQDLPEQPVSISFNNLKLIVERLILRNFKYYSVIINGIAGSGKTSIAMHRISYILYELKGTITSRNIRIQTSIIC